MCNMYKIILYSIESINGYGFLSFAKNMSKNIGKNKKIKPQIKLETS